MVLKQVLEVFELMDKPQANGKEIIELLKERGATEEERHPRWESSAVWVVWAPALR